MEKTQPDDEIRLKKQARRRLIGAIGLVVAAIVILPMVLEHEPKEAHQVIEIRIPSEKTAGEFAPKVMPDLAAPTAPTTASAPVSAEPAPKTTATHNPIPAPAAAPVSAATPPTSAKPQNKTASAASLTKNAAPAPAAIPAAAPPASPQKEADVFVVQLGAFSDANKAQQRQKSLAANKIKAYTEKLKTDKGDMTRVRAGPFASREEAEKANVRIKALGIKDGLVTRRQDAP